MAKKKTRTVTATIDESFSKVVTVEVPVGVDAEEYIEELCNSDAIDITNDGYAFERQIEITEDPEACQEDS